LIIGAILWVANLGNATVAMVTKKQLETSGMPVPAITLRNSAFDDPWGMAFDAENICGFPTLSADRSAS